MSENVSKPGLGVQRIDSTGDSTGKQAYRRTSDRSAFRARVDPEKERRGIKGKRDKTVSPRKMFFYFFF